MNDWITINKTTKSVANEACIFFGWHHCTVTINKTNRVVRKGENHSNMLPVKVYFFLKTEIKKNIRIRVDEAWIDRWRKKNKRFFFQPDV